MVVGGFTFGLLLVSLCSGLVVLVGLILGFLYLYLVGLVVFVVCWFGLRWVWYVLIICCLDVVSLMFAFCWVPAGLLVLLIWCLSFVLFCVDLLGFGMLCIL